MLWAADIAGAAVALPYVAAHVAEVAALIIKWRHAPLLWLAQASGGGDVASDRRAASWKGFLH